MAGISAFHAEGVGSIPAFSTKRRNKMKLGELIKYMRTDQEISVYYDNVLIYRGFVDGVVPFFYRKEVHSLEGCNNGEIEVQLMEDITSMVIKL